MDRRAARITPGFCGAVTPVHGAFLPRHRIHTKRNEEGRSNLETIMSWRHGQESGSYHSWLLWSCYSRSRSVLTSPPNTYEKKRRGKKQSRDHYELEAWTGERLVSLLAFVELLLPFTERSYLATEYIRKETKREEAIL